MNLKEQGYPSWSFGHMHRYLKTLKHFYGAVSPWTLKTKYQEAVSAIAKLRELFNDWPLLYDYAEQCKYNRDDIDDMMNKLDERYEQLEDSLKPPSQRGL